jgi:adenylate cyclase
LWRRLVDVPLPLRPAVSEGRIGRRIGGLASFVVGAASAGGCCGGDEERRLEVGDLRLRGRSEPLRTYEPLDAEEAGSPATKTYAEAFAKLETHDPAAIAAFAALVGLRPADPLAQYRLKRLLNGSVGTEIVTQ